jgi:hypothetical protein
MSEILCRASVDGISFETMKVQCIEWCLKTDHVVLGDVERDLLPFADAMAQMGSAVERWAELPAQFQQIIHYATETPEVNNRLTVLARREYSRAWQAALARKKKDQKQTQIKNANDYARRVTARRKQGKSDKKKSRRKRR